MTSTIQFCSIIKQRSVELNSSAVLLFDNKHYGQVISIMRQELDSLIRVIFLLEINVLTKRQHYIMQTLNNQKWTKINCKKTITDREMIELSNELYGWTKSVYKFGCAFIHLSPMTNYKNQSPFSQLTQDEIDEIKLHLNSYHGFPLSSYLNLESIIPYLMKVLKKISSNLYVYLDDLRDEKTNSLQEEKNFWIKLFGE